ncbi:nucleotidyltransferase family protein [Halomonas sp. 328]|uniref:hypothetical protein n=1 Tax=Halomonas sp. 328 TaxID=2776704 RepID=UPI0018A7D80D|nr:hypothetical protein [Halomonas sp. 328]MBF8221870.1 hypothetical protein [Halomonas sp. 328]
MHREATQWIVSLLKKRQIPFLVCGGLAARGYGATRALNDIDLFVPGEHFDAVVEAGQAFISKPARHYREAGWDLTYVQFKHSGIKIEVGSAHDPRIFDTHRQEWVALEIDFSRYRTVRLLGMELPLMLDEDLIRYKSALSRPVDLEDIRAIRSASVSLGTPPI